VDAMNDEDEFNDWINHLHSFVHMIQDKRLPSPIFPYSLTFITGAQISSEEEDDHYDLIPRSKIAEFANSRIEAVKQWHQDLQ
jgi:hypothetical protein